MKKLIAILVLITASVAWADFERLYIFDPVSGNLSHNVFKNSETGQLHRTRQLGGVNVNWIPGIDALSYPEYTLPEGHVLSTDCSDGKRPTKICKHDFILTEDYKTVRVEGVLPEAGNSVIANGKRVRGGQIVAQSKDCPEKGEMVVDKSRSAEMTPLFVATAKAGGFFKVDGVSMAPYLDCLGCKMVAGCLDNGEIILDRATFIGGMGAQLAHDYIRIADPNEVLWIKDYKMVEGQPIHQPVFASGDNTKTAEATATPADN